MGGDQSAALDPALAKLDRLWGCRNRGRLEDLERPLERQIHGSVHSPLTCHDQLKTGNSISRFVSLTWQKEKTGKTKKKMYAGV
jgi:hypothetical protein